jgi:hypothetical protein
LLVEHGGLHGVDEIGCALYGLTDGCELVVEEDDHGLPLDDGLAGGTLLVENHLRGVVLGILVDVKPLVEIVALVLQGMYEFVSHDRLLDVRGDPIEKIDGFVVGVIPSLDLFLVEAEHVLAQIEVAGNKAELFEGHGGAVEALAISLLFHARLDVLGDLLAGGQLLFDSVEDGKAGTLTGKLQDVINGAEELLGLGLADVMLLGGGRRFLRGRRDDERECERNEPEQFAGESHPRPLQSELW